MGTPVSQSLHGEVHRLVSASPPSLRLGRTEGGLTAGRTGERTRHDSPLPEAGRGTGGILASEKPLHPARTHSGASPWAEVQMPGAHRGARCPSSPKARPSGTTRAACPRAPRRRWVNSAPVGSLARALSPAPPGVRGRPRPPSPLPHSATPAAPTSGHPTSSPAGPSRAAAQTPRPNRPGARRPRPAAPPPRARPFPARKELLVPSTALGPPCAPAGPPPRSQTHSPALGDWAPNAGGWGRVPPL